MAEGTAPSRVLGAAEGAGSSCGLEHGPGASGAGAPGDSALHARRAGRDKGGGEAITQKTERPSRSSTVEADGPVLKPGSRARLIGLRARLMNGAEGELSKLSHKRGAWRVLMYPKWGAEGGEAREPEVAPGPSKRAGEEAREALRRAASC